MSANIDRDKIIREIEDMIARWEADGGETYRELAAHIVHHIFRKCSIDVSKQLK